MVLQSAPGLVVGLHRAVHKDDWRHTPVLRAQVEAGLVGPAPAPAAGACVPPVHLRIDTKITASSLPIAVDAYCEAAVPPHMQESLVQVREDALLHFFDAALGGEPTATCQADLANKPCILRENDHLRTNTATATLEPVENLRCDGDGKTWEDFYGCPTYVFALTTLDPSTGDVTTHSTVRAHKTSYYGWVIWKVGDDNNLRNTDTTVGWGATVRGHYAFSGDPFAGGTCTLPELTADRSQSQTAAHMAVVVAERALDATELDKIFCGRFRGSPECDVGMVLDTAYGNDCVPCTPSTCAHLGTSYSLCANSADPDDTTNAAQNTAPPGVLSGIVAPLGRGDALDPCSHLHPRVVVTAVDETQNTLGAQECCSVKAPTATHLDLPGRVAYVPYAAASALWNGEPEDSLPACVQTINVQNPTGFAPLDDERSPLPCRTTAAFAFPAQATSRASAATIFTRGFVLGRGAVLLAIDAGDVVVHEGFRQRRVAEALAVLVAATAADAAKVNANLPNAPHVFVSGDTVWAWNARTGGRAELCSTDANAVSRRGRTQWVVPDVDTGALPGDSVHVYQLFLVGESRACREAQCVEANVAGDADPSPHVEKLALLPGTGLWLDTGKGPDPVLGHGCMTVDFVGTSAAGAFFEVTPHAVAAHLNGQSFASLGTCADTGAQPCRVTDPATGHVWYHVLVFKPDGSSLHVALRTDTVEDYPDAPGTVYVDTPNSARRGHGTRRRGRGSSRSRQSSLLTNSLQCASTTRRSRRPPGRGFTRARSSMPHSFGVWRARLSTTRHTAKNQPRCSCIAKSCACAWPKAAPRAIPVHFAAPAPGPRRRHGVLEHHDDAAHGAHGRQRRKCAPGGLRPRH